MIDEHRKFRFCRLPREAGAECAQAPGVEQPRNVLRCRWRFCSRLVPSPWPRMPDSRLALRPTHAIQHGRQV
jgi:hypothetical protein